MAITLICPGRNPARWIRALKDLDPGLDVRVWPDDGPKEDIELALTWAHPPGELNRYPRLGCISSMGAGVDHLMSDPDLPPGVPVVRLVDQDLVADMAEYLMLSVLFHFRQFHVYEQFQKEKRWRPLAPGNKADFPVGIMGMGQLGTAAAKVLKGLGFPVTGWKNTLGSVPDIDIFSGPEQLGTFLTQSRILICLLPLTPATRHILDLSLFSQLPQGAFLINAARGGHLKEEDLITALDREMLSYACLDVFETEPLPPDHPFWQHSSVRITPHAASLTRPASVAPQILDNLSRLRQGNPLLNPVSREKGY